MTSTSFWQFLQPCWCQTVAVLLFLWIHQWDGEGGQVAWATACPPYHNAQAYIHPCHQLHTHNCTWRGHSSFTIYMVLTQHGKQQILVISHHSIGIEWGTSGCFRWWERSSCLIGQLLPPQAGQPPVSKVLSHHGLLSSLGAWRLGEHLTSRLSTTAPGNNKRKMSKKRPALKLGCWNVWTMMPSLSHDLQDISNARKTAVINNELKRLNVDIATL